MVKIIPYIRSVEILNGEDYMLIDVYECDRCEREIIESDPHHLEGDKQYCIDCSFIDGFIDGKEYLSSIGGGLTNCNASIRDNEIVIWHGKKPPWEKTNKDIRNSNQYREWRNKVFERDNYTCQHCGQRGGVLNAHHIKHFSEYKSLRYVVGNGLTLCFPCHKEVHKKSG